MVDFESSFIWGDEVTCPNCGSIFETEWDYIDTSNGSMAQWISGLIISGINDE